MSVTLNCTYFVNNVQTGTETITSENSLVLDILSAYARNMPGTIYGIKSIHLLGGTLSDNGMVSYDNQWNETNIEVDKLYGELEAVDTEISMNIYWGTPYPVQTYFLDECLIELYVDNVLQQQITVADYNSNDYSNGIKVNSSPNYFSNDEYSYYNSIKTELQSQADMVAQSYLASNLIKKSETMNAPTYNENNKLAAVTFKRYYETPSTISWSFTDKNGTTSTGNTIVFVDKNGVSTTITSL